MSEWKYRKTEPSDIRGLCCHCNKNLQKKKSNGKFNTLCSGCERHKYSSPEAKERLKEYKKANRHKYDDKSYRDHKTNVCVMCLFTSEYRCQFDVDHIDGNHNNNSLTNLQTLCANCHRLKTLLNGEGIYKYHK